MRNKFKLKKKLVSIALALVLAAQPLASLPMNVFAGTGENGMLTAPLKADLKELNPGQQIKSKYIVQKSVDFSDKKVLSARVVQAPGIVYAKEKIGNSMRDVYIIADLNGILNAAAEVEAAAAEAVKAPSVAAQAAAAQIAAQAAAEAAKAAWAAAEAAEAAEAAQIAAQAAQIGAKIAALNYADWVEFYKKRVDGVFSAIVADYDPNSDQTKKDWLNAAYAAVKAAKKMADGKGLDLEAKLKIAYMAYRIAQFTWLHATSVPDKQTKANECKERADALQEVIDRMYSDKVGDIEAQAEKAQG